MQLDTLSLEAEQEFLYRICTRATAIIKQPEKKILFEPRYGNEKASLTWNLEWVIKYVGLYAKDRKFDRAKEIARATGLEEELAGIFSDARQYDQAAMVMENKALSTKDAATRKRIEQKSDELYVEFVKNCDEFKLDTVLSDEFPTIRPKEVAALLTLDYQKGKGTFQHKLSAIAESVRNIAGASCKDISIQLCAAAKLCEDESTVDGVIDKLRSLNYRTVVAYGKMIAMLKMTDKIVVELQDDDKARGLWNRAREIKDSGVAAGLYQKAIDAYESAGLLDCATIVAREAGLFERAAEYNERRNQHFFAADDYVKAGNIDGAARCYAKSGFHKKAIDMYRDVGRLEDAMRMCENACWFARAESIANELGLAKKADAYRYRTSMLKSFSADYE